MRRTIATVLMWAVLLVGPLRPVYAEGLLPSSTAGVVLVVVDGTLTNNPEVPAEGVTSPPTNDAESWWKRLLKSIGNWFSDRWQAVQDWWEDLPNWAKGLIVGIVAAVILIAIVIAVIAAGIVLSGLAIVAIVGAVIGLVVAGLWYGLAEDGEFNLAKAIGWVLLGGVIGAAVSALLWEVLPIVGRFLVRVDSAVAFSISRVLATVTTRLTAILSPVAAYLAPRLAPVVAWFNAAVAWVQRVAQPVVNAVGLRWAVLMERLAPTVTAVTTRVAWLMQVTGMTRMLDGINTLFIRLGMWFNNIVAKAPRLIISTINGFATAGIYIATADTIRLDELIFAFLWGFAFTYGTMLPTYSVTLAEARMMRTFLRENRIPPKYWNQTIEAFSRGVTVETLPAGTVVYRYYGTGSQPRGNWVTIRPLQDPVNQLALPPGNEALGLQRFVITQDTQVLRGIVAPNFGRPGGAIQIYLPDKNLLGEVLP